MPNIQKDHQLFVNVIGVKKTVNLIVLNIVLMNVEILAIENRKIN